MPICLHRGYPTLFALTERDNNPHTRVQIAGFYGHWVFAAFAAAWVGGYSRLMPAATTAAA
jgi:hypothetical protein